MIYLHIGTSKTGSKSLQKFLDDHREELHECGWAFYRGFLKNGSNHTELHLATVRETCETIGRLKWPEAKGDDYRKKIAAKIKDFLKEKIPPNAIFSNEGLSFLREPEELKKLSDMLNVLNDQIKVIVYIRNKSDFISSYKDQILKNKGRSLSKNPKSALYLGEDAWVANFNPLIQVYQNQFGKENVLVLNYDIELEKRGSVLPSFVKALDLPEDFVIKNNNYHLNKRSNKSR